MLYQPPSLPAPLAAPHPVQRQAFMSRAMWFAWLLRDDVRAGAGLGNVEAQREFVAWWLLRGVLEYPRAWSAGAEQLDVAMEPVFIEPRVRLPRLLRALHRQRADLQAAFPLTEEAGAAEFLCWYRVHGVKELPVGPHLPPIFAALTEAPTSHAPWREDAHPAPRVAVWLHRSSAELQAEFDVTSSEARQAYIAWFQEHGAAQLPSSHPAAMAPPEPAIPVFDRGFGVNLVGYPRGEFGIGEDIRMLSKALDAADVPHVVIDLEHGSQARQLDDTLSHRLVRDLRYDVTVFCQSAFDTARVFLEHGPGLFASRKNIGNWPWELERFPACWRDAYELVDEVWASSRFTQAAYAADIGERARLMPPAVALDPAIFSPALRQRGESGPRPFVFICPFDPNSYPERKNPVAAIRAFRAAFSSGAEAVRLVLKANGTLQGRGDWMQVFEEAAGDPRVDILEGTSTRREFLTMVVQADCLVSSHRSEGFGRNVAEAILLGVPVLATGYSGCSDFLVEAERLAFDLRYVSPGDYPFGAGMVWADPNSADLAARMREMTSGVAPPEGRAAALEAVHGLAKAGARYRTRLREMLDRTSRPDARSTEGAPVRRPRQARRIYKATAGQQHAAQVV